MARTSQINYQRVTFSFPKKVIDKLRIKVPNNEMSKFVAEAIEEKLENHEIDSENLLKSIRDLAEKAEPHYRDERSSIEILREIRYHGKY